jgi:predicted O-methyltransferase YrrM
MSIIDCCVAFQETDLLLLRMAQLDPVVDRFVIVEADRTHAGAPKPLSLAANRDKFARYRDKIQWHAAALPEGDGLVWTWRREIAQRNAILDALADCAPDDMIMISDADEIPRRSFVQMLPHLEQDHIAIAQQRLYYYTFNHTAPEVAWMGTRATQYANVQALGADGVRYAGRERGGFPRLWTMRDAGWHLSYFGGERAIRAKMQSFLHQELVNADVTDEATIARRVAAGEDAYGRPWQQFTIDWASDLPDAVYEKPRAWAAHFHPDYAPCFHEDWMHPEQSTALAWLAGGAPDGAALEIGAWEGASTIAIARGLRDRVLHVVDTWAGNEDEGASHPSVMAAQARDVEAQFQRNVRAFGLTVEAHRMDWRDYALPEGIAFAHLDAAHDETSVRAQLTALLPRLVPGAVLVGDDYYATGVEAAVKDLLPGFATNDRMWWWRNE